MSDNFLDDDFVRVPGALRPDMDAAFAEARQIHDASASDVHDTLTEAAAAYTKNTLAHSMLSDSGSAILVEDPQLQARIQDLAAKESGSAANQLLQQATQQELGQATGLGAGDASIRNIENLTNQSTGQMAGEATHAADAQSHQGAARPSDLESTLAAVRLNKDRQQRLVVAGDPAVMKVFNDKLASRGQLHYQGGVAVISVSRARALKTLAEASREVHGASGEAVHALSLKMNREGGGDLVGLGGPGGVLSAIGDNVRTSFENIRAGIQNNFAARHEVDVVVVGAPAHIKEKLAELGELTATMEKAKHIPEGSAPLQDVDGRKSLKLPEDGGPAKLEATAELQQVVSHMKLKVDAFTAERLAQAAELKAFEDDKRMKAMAAAKEKAATGEATGASADGAPVKAEKPNEHSEKLAASLDKAFQDTNLLHSSNAKNQLEAVSLLTQFRRLKDPTERELQTLPEAQRQTAIVQLAALVQKVDKQEFGKDAVKSLDSHSADTSSARQKVEAYVAMEAARDANFGAKAQPILKDLVDRKAITEEQATAVSDQIAKAHAAESAKSAGAAPASASTSAQVSTSSAPQAPAQQASAPAAAQPAPAAPVAATAAPAKEAEKGTEAPATSSALAAPAGPAAGTSTATATDASSASSPATAASTSKDTAAVTNATPTASAVGDAKTALRSTVEQLASRSSAGQLDATQAYGLVASLDAIRTKPLSALDSGTGDQPSKTLANIGVVLKELESGKHGDELKALAKDLADPVQRWAQQDAQRLGKDAATSVSATGPAATDAAQSGKPGSSTAELATSGSAAKGVSTAPDAAADKATSQAPAQPTEAQLAKEQAVQRVWETETAGGKLASMMANPPGSFTNRDKSWNETNIQKAAQEVLRMDPEALTQLSSAQRTKAAVYSAWLADKASNGQLPGFSSESGKELAGKLVEKATALWSKLEPDAKIPKDVQTLLTKADAMVDARLELDRSASAGTSKSSTNQATSARTISPQAASALAKDLVHSVYRQPDMSEAQAKYLLKNTANLTPESIKSMDPATQAKTAVALEAFVKSVRDGAMGEVAHMPPAVQKSVAAAEAAADKLVSTLSKDPAMSAHLDRAQQELSGKSGAATKASASQASTGGAKQVESRIPGKSSGPSLER